MHTYMHTYIQLQLYNVYAYYPFYVGYIRDARKLRKKPFGASSITMLFFSLRGEQHLSWKICLGKNRCFFSAT